MILLVFKFQNELMKFKVEDRSIYYIDRLKKDWLRIIPKDKNFMIKALLSRNKIPHKLVEIANLSEKNKQEYESCKTEQELANVIIKDCQRQGLKLIKP